MKNLNDLRQEVDKTLDPDWLKRYGDAAWRAALALVGERPDPPPPSPPSDANEWKQLRKFRS